MYIAQRLSSTSVAQHKKTSWVTKKSETAYYHWPRCGSQGRRTSVKTKRRVYQAKVCRHLIFFFWKKMNLTIVSAATHNVITMSAWSTFCSTFYSIGNLVLVSDRNPCVAAPIVFARAPPKSKNNTWGFHIMQCQYLAWKTISLTTPYYMYVRPDTHWFITPNEFLNGLWPHIHSRDVWIPDTEHYWGFNDRFAVMNHAGGGAYFSRYMDVIADPNARLKNTESFLQKRLKRMNMRVGTFPTIAALLCCLQPEQCFRKKCYTIRFKADVLRVKYPFEAQAAIQNALVYAEGTKFFKGNLLTMTRPWIRWNAWKNHERTDDWEWMVQP